MKAGSVALFGLFFLVLMPCIGSSQDKYVPKQDEEIYGTWKNVVDPIPQERIVTAADVKEYLHISDPTPWVERTLVIDSKWVDSDGNIWYRTFGVNTTGYFKGARYQALNKISKSGTVWESASVAIGHMEFDARQYPITMDPKAVVYRVYLRVQE